MEAISDKHQATRRMRGALNRFDVFVGLNTAALVGTTAYAYAANELEFGLYAVILLLMIVALWRGLRRYRYPLWMLALLQGAMLAHFAGGFLHIDGTWFYAYEIAGVLRYDKLVHFVNTAIVAVVGAHLFHQSGLKLREWEAFIVVMTAAGFGTLVEILEYTAVVLLPRTGVGDYHNNLQDLIANLLGAIAGWIVYRSAGRFGARRHTP